MNNGVEEIKQDGMYALMGMEELDRAYCKETRLLFEEVVFYDGKEEVVRKAREKVFQVK